MCWPPRGRSQRRRRRGAGLRALPAGSGALRRQAPRARCAGIAGRSGVGSAIGRGRGIAGASRAPGCRPPSLPPQPPRSARAGDDGRGRRSSLSTARRPGRPAPGWSSARSRPGTTCGVATSSSSASCSPLEPDRRVLFVEPAFDVLHEWRRRSGRRRQRALRPLDADGRIVRFEPRKVWPRLLGPMRGPPACAGRSAWPPSRFGPRSSRSVDQRPELRAPGRGDRLAGDLRHHRRLDRSVDPGPGAAPRRARRGAPVRRCGGVVVCSDALAASRRHARPDLDVIPNAVDAARLTRPRPRPADLPAGPVAVYVGTLHEDRLDVDLVDQLAGSRPDLTVVLIGPDSLSPTSARRLDGRPNVVRLGPRPHDDVGAYLQHAEVVVVPHVVSPFTESLDPIKAYECLAVGRPTVATPVAGFRGLGSPISCATADDFSAAVGRARRRSALPRCRDPCRRGTSGRSDSPSSSSRSRAGRVRPLRVVFLDHCAQLSGGELALVRLVRALRAVIEVSVILGEHGPIEDQVRQAGATVEVLELDARVATVRRDRVTVSGGGIGAPQSVRSTTSLAVSRASGSSSRTSSTPTRSSPRSTAGWPGVWRGVPVVWHIRDRIAPDYLPAGAVRLVRNLARWLPAAVIVPSVATRDALAGGVWPGNPAVASSTTWSNPCPWTRRSPRDRTGWSWRWSGDSLRGRASTCCSTRSPAPSPTARPGCWSSAARCSARTSTTTQLRAQVDELGLGDRVVFTGFVDDVTSLLATVDCVVHASVIAEPFGQVVVEAMAAGRAVIASRPRRSGRDRDRRRRRPAVPTGDVEALAERLARRVGSRPAPRLGRRGRGPVPRLLARRSSVPQSWPAAADVLARRRVGPDTADGRIPTAPLNNS